MSLELQIIDITDYDSERSRLQVLLKKIWIAPSSFENALHSFDRWGESKTESGEYFYILQDSNKIGVIGYFIPNLLVGDFGLYHHGTTVKGTGRKSLNLLVDHIKRKYGSSFKRLIELIPAGREELIEKFEDWGFYLSNSQVPEWEPKRDYYKYVMIKD